MSVKKAAEQLAGLSGEEKKLALHIASLIERATEAAPAVKMRKKRGPNKPKLAAVQFEAGKLTLPQGEVAATMRVEAPAGTVRSVPRPGRVPAKGPLARKVGAKSVPLRKSGRVSPEALADALKGS